jgi:hypothetical protein
MMVVRGRRRLLFTRALLLKCWGRWLLVTLLSLDWLLSAQVLLWPFWLLGETLQRRRRCRLFVLIRFLAQSLLWRFWLMIRFLVRSLLRRFWLLVLVLRWLFVRILRFTFVLFEPEYRAGLYAVTTVIDTVHDCTRMHSRGASNLHVR